MARRVRPIRELAGYFRKELPHLLRQAAAEALLETTVKAEGRAKRNAARNFTGTSVRPKTGNLLNAIYSAFEMTVRGGQRRIGRAFVAVRANKGNAGTRPYGRIQEYGGVVEPKKAKHLWIPLFGPKSRLPGNLHNMTPRDFVQGMKTKHRSLRFWIINSPHGKVAGVSTKTAGTSSSGMTVRDVVLFSLRNRVEIPARPYVTPAIEAELPFYGVRYAAAVERIRRKRG